ncbi:ferric reductase NAD binding domain-containing protein [Linnemannia elongata]|nr:ferric reductase NAD binding domain-containing protein [Linnemannia elongata]
MPPQRSQLRTRLDQFLLNESPRIIFLSIWSLLQFLIFYFSFEIYNRSTHYSQARAKLGVTLGVARGAAAVINFDCGVILFSVCRNLISVLRSTFLNGVVPFDKNVLFHKTVAWSIVLFSVVHSAGHYVNYYRLEQAEQREKGEVKRSAQYMALFTGPGFTGHVLMLILFLMVTSSVERVRRKGFETFWYTHHLFILFFLTLTYHGAFCFIRADTPPYCKSSPTSYKFVLGSLFFYILERTVREFRARLPATSISKIVLHPSKVLEVQIKKTNSRQGDDSSFFRAKAGQYIFLNCPDISAFEWHPFTITSAPEEDYVSVHIRIVGDWTTAFARRLGCSFDDEQQFWIEELRNRMQFHTPPRPTNLPIITLPRVLLDGPYGSPSEDAFNYEIAVLVGAGIGVTPFASVLKHIWYSVMQPTKIITLRKVYFFWVCRDRDAFEWFQDLLIALEEQNLSDFLEIRSYLTGELGKEELDTVMLGEEFNDARDRDAITGLRSPTYYGRPNFDKIFGELALEHPREHGQVGVFFCGPKPLGKTLHRCARKYKFKFHKGNYN